jgi:hypothetical protein
MDEWKALLDGAEPSIYFTDEGTLVAMMHPTDPTLVEPGE